MKRASALTLALAAVPLAPAAVPLVPVQTFFGTQYVRSAAISPDGQKIAFLAPNGGTYSLAILDIATRTATVPVHIEDESIQSFTWKGSDHLIFTGEVAGNEVPQVASTTLSGKRVFSILKPQLTKVQQSIYSGSPLSFLPEDPRHIIVEGYTTDSDYSKEQDSRLMSEVQPIIMRADVLTGKRTLICPASDGNPSHSFSDFAIDHEGQVRTAVRHIGDTAELLYRDTSDGAWRPMRKFNAQAVGWSVVGFTPDDRGVYVNDFESSDSGTLRVYNPQEQTLGPALFTPEGGELGVEYPPSPGLVFSPDRKRLIGLSYTTDKVHYKWLEPKYAHLQQTLEHTFPGMIVVMGTMSDDETRIVVRTYTASNPGAYYLLDLAKGSLGLVTMVAPGIDPAKMAPVLPIAFTARDGLEIHGYLTLPLDFRPGTPVPLILHPHGGPFGPRDTWVFDPEVQFLANRGYAVLQVNFRGSGGYGSKFEQAGFREWGGKMQDDLTDGVRWAIAQGYGDPKRIGVYGASYGGYATLAALVYTPEIYKCGVNYVGVTDLVEQTRRKYQEENAENVSFFRQRIGDDEAVLYAHSPVNFVERIRVPLLNAYGENDPRVDISQWYELRGQLDKYHKDYQFMVGKDEGHGFAHPEDAVAWYTAMEAFLAKNL